MDYQFTNDKPIYLQLMDVFKAGIISGELPQGSRLESVRDLALKAQVNPNTMQKALSELERLGLIRTERTSGRFITDDGSKIEAMKKELAEEEIIAFLERMKTLGFTKDDVIQLIKKED
ncbi:MAG: GntR family transcriptional regulator [Treponema sp.]|nr:GntR family transcriptional regulator [Treponema sp.]